MLDQRTQTNLPLPAPPPARRRPTTFGYVVGGTIAVAAVIGGLTWGFVAYDGYLDEISAYPRISVPGAQEVRLAAGDHIFFYEASGETPSDMRVTITDAGGRALPTAAYRPDVRYDAPDGAVGRAFSQFTTAEEGEYLVTVEAEPQPTQVAVVDGIPGLTMVTVTIAGLVFASGALGLGLIVTTAIRRAR